MKTQRLFSRLFCLAVLIALLHESPAASLGYLPGNTNASLVEPVENSFQIDGKGVSVICGNDSPSSAVTSLQSVSPAGKPHQPPPPPPPILPAGIRMWETIPGVIRNNGTDTFRVEVNVNGPVSNVTMSVVWPFLSASGQTNIILNDNGTNGDRIAGDGIFTSELIRFDTNNDSVLAPYYEYDTNSPAGLMPYYPGQLKVGETNGTVSNFLIGPEVGIMDKNIPLVSPVQLASNVVITPHLINVVGTNLETQKILRDYSYETGEIPGKIYSVLPDAFDFFVYFSTYRVEYTPYDAYGNGIAGIHQSIQVNYTGTGQSEFTNSTLYGSAGRLLGVNVLDTYDRGMSCGICTHEIMHQWGSYMSAFPFSDGQHYVDQSSADSPLGGSKWSDNGDGTWALDCSGRTHLDNFDQYLMGLIATNAVADLRVYSPTSTVYCGGIISNVVNTTTIQDVVNAYGLRTPGPSTSKRDFSIGFVVESNQRFLTPVELTYYEIFAAYYTKPFPANQPDPKIYYNWTTISRFFGQGTTWSSAVLPLIQPVIWSLTVSTNGHCAVSATGQPGRNYTLAASSNLQTWTMVTNQTAGTNGLISITDANSAMSGVRFYRLTWP